MNPLKALFDKLGLSVHAVASRLGVKPAQIEQALSLEPREPLSTYLDIVAAFGVTMRLRADGEDCIWIDLAAIDSLYSNNEWRKNIGLENLIDRAAMRDKVKLMRSRKKTYGEIIDYFEGNWIPTSNGCRYWRNSSIPQILGSRKVSDTANRQITGDSEFFADFRAFLVEKFISEITPFDAFAPIRYEMEEKIIGDRLYIVNKHPMPSALRRWINGEILRLNWFEYGKWGSGYRPEGFDEAPTLSMAAQSLTNLRRTRDEPDGGERTDEEGQSKSKENSGDSEID